MAMSVSVDLQVAVCIDNLPDKAQIGEWVGAAIEASGAPGTMEYDIAIRLVDEGESQILNRRYRQQDQPTNVLSFPYEGMAGLPPGEICSLGDLAICGPLVVAEALEQGKDCQAHWAHIVIHGTLHLLGYDHQDDGQAASMEALEESVLQGFRIENPYRKI